MSLCPLKKIKFLETCKTPELSGQEFKKIGRPDIPLYVYHMNPQYIHQIEKEILSLKIPNVIFLKDGHSLIL